MVAQFAQPLRPDPHSLPAVLLVERNPYEVLFVESLLYRVFGSPLWLWHEERLDIALKLLQVCRFHLILLDHDHPRLTIRSLIRRVKAVSAGTPIILRLPPEQATHAEPRHYGVAEVIPRQHSESLLAVLRRYVPGG
jgi:DNA-binding response OmpR family regulator